MKILAMFIGGIYVFMFVMMMCICSKAEAGELILTLYTYHHNKEPDYRNDNLGLIYRHGDERAKWNVGAYNNSDYQQSFFVGRSYDFQLTEHVMFTPSAGLVTGYKDNPVLPYVFPTFVIANRVALTPLITFSTRDDIKTSWGVNAAVKILDF